MILMINLEVTSWIWKVKMRNKNECGKEIIRLRTVWMVSQLKDNSCLDFPSLWSWFAGWGTNIEHSGVFSGGPGSWARGILLMVGEARVVHIWDSGSNRVTIDVLPGRPMGPLTLLIIGSITMPHTAQHSQKKKHFLHWIIDWENFPLFWSWIVRFMNTGLLSWCQLSFFYSCVLICFNLLKWYL